MVLNEDQALDAKRAEASAAWASFLGGLDEFQIGLLKDYTILDESGAPTVITYDGKHGPFADVKVSLDACQRLVKADTTKKHKWLDWILFRAGGGKAGQAASKAGLEKLKIKFIDERVRGYIHPVKGTLVKKVTREEAEAKWLKNLPEIKAILDNGDEATIERFDSFGFAKDWPGYQRRYQRVADAVTLFLSIVKQAQQMNKEIESGESTLDLIPTEPGDYDEPAALTAAAGKVQRYFAAKNARADIRHDKTIYDDDVIEAVVPLTYAAAVHYGYDSWAWANREKFDNALMGEVPDWQHPWKSSRSVYVYLTFKCPVPVWIKKIGDKEQRYFLENLALVLEPHDFADLASHKEELEIHDQENNKTRTVADIRNMILAEPTRQDSPDEQESTVYKRGPNVYKTREEAEDVAKRFDACVDAVIEWAKTFNPKQIKRDPLADD